MSFVFCLSSWMFFRSLWRGTARVAIAPRARDQPFMLEIPKMMRKLHGLGWFSDMIMGGCIPVGSLPCRRPCNRNRKWIVLLQKLWSGTLTKLLQNKLDMKDCARCLAFHAGFVCLC